jgi:hypothetical protein
VQLEEFEALEAIFGAEFTRVASDPPTCVIRLREGCDGADGDEAAAAAAAAAAAVPPSSLFSLRFKLPKVRVVGPRGTREAPGWLPRVAAACMSR